MAKAKFSYVPNIPTPGEAQLAGAGPNDPVAGIHLLNAQMERRRGMDEYNTTMEQAMQSQNEQAKQAGILEMAKIVANASNPYAQAPLATQQFPGSADQIAQLQAQEQQSLQAENFQKIASGIHSALQGGVATGPDPLAAVGLPGIPTNTTPLDIQKEQMHGETSRDVARIGANASIRAAQARGQKPTSSVAYNTIAPDAEGNLQFKDTDYSRLLPEINKYRQSTGQPPLGVSQVPDEEIPDVDAQIDPIIARKGLIGTGARAHKIVRPDGKVIYEKLAKDPNTGKMTKVQMELQPD